MKLYRTRNGIILEKQGSHFAVPATSWDDLLTSHDLHAQLEAATTPGTLADLLAPCVSQDVWASGVTYYRSRNARMEESKDAGGGTFYDRVYSAPRPELFFKSTGPRVVGPAANVRIRRDATWSVPEPELTVLFSPSGAIIGFTIGNDMSSRDIEGENPLYLPQAKTYDGSCAIGPCILIASEPLAKSTTIHIEILRGGSQVFSGETTLNELKRDIHELRDYLFRENSFPAGVLLMTGTGVVPGDDFTLASGDIIRIRIGGIGTLENTVE